MHPTSPPGLRERCSGPCRTRTKTHLRPWEEHRWRPGDPKERIVGSYKGSVGSLRLRIPLLTLFQSAYHTELGVNPATIMPVDILHDCELGFGKGVVTHNIRIFHAIGQRAVNTFDTR